MASRIKLKRSTTPNSAPTTSDLTDKEVALNIIDRTLFVNNAGTIEEIANADPNDEKIVPSMFSSSITDGVGNTWYVSTNGTDKATLGSVNPRHGETTGANQWGATPMTAFASLKYCLDNYAQSGDLIVIAAGQYEEVFPLTVPDGIAIKGAGLKSTFIRPSVSTNSEDAFLIEGNCNIEDLCVNDFYYDNVNDTGYAFRLASNYTVAVDGRRPYIQRCSVITKGSTVTQADPRGYASGDAGRGALVDGADAATTSSEASLLFNECTFVVPNSVGLYLKNGARCEWLNCFTYFAADSIKAENPGGSGFAGQGRTRLKLNTVNGTFNAGNTISYYDTDGTTVLASGTIDENDGTYIYVDGQGTGRFAEAAETVEGKAVTVNGDAQLDTTNKQFGASSLLLDGTGDYLSLASSSDFGFGTGDFAIEMWVRPSSISGNRIIYDSRISASTEVKPTLYLNSGILTYYVNGAARITGATLSINTWYHIVVSRSGTSTKLFVNGTQSGSTYTDTNDYGTTAPILIGSNIFFASNWSGYIDEVRVSKGVARYTANFTSPTTEYFADTNTSLLLHFNGIDGSTDIFDGGISSQDIRSSSGGTAQYITLADYTDFGAELRSIGSASVYGQRGVTANGKGVRLRCILHNFGYVGVGADQSNDISNVNQANEIIEINGGRALFTSMDQNGDFRVGNAFFVDQEKGTVSFVGGTSGGGTTFDQLIVTGTGNTTTILPTSITVGNLTLSGDDIISGTGQITITPFTSGNVRVGLSTTNTIDTTTGDLILTSNGVGKNYAYSVNNSSGTAYTFSGNATGNNPSLNVLVGDTLTFNVNVPGDPFYIVTGIGLSGGYQANLQASGVTNAGATSGTVTWTVPSAGLYYYISSADQTLVGTITVVDPVVKVDDDLVVTGDVNVLGNLTSNNTIEFTSSSFNTATVGTLNVTTTNASGLTSLFDDLIVYSNDFIGNITGGSGYPVGIYTNVPLTGGSGTGAEATITSTAGGIATGSIIDGGDNNYFDGTYYNVPLINVSGSGSGAKATIVVSSDPSFNVTSVTITSPGIGYQINDILTIDLGLGTGFEYKVNTVQNKITEVIITDYGDGDYAIGDDLSAEVSNLGGSGSGFNYEITGREPNLTVSYSGKNTTSKGTLEVNASSWFANADNSFVAIGFQNDHNFGDQNITDPDDAEKLEVNGNIRTQGNVKALGSFVASLGSITQPSIKFDVDPISSSNWDRTGFFAEYGEGHGKINVIGDQGRIARFSADRTDYYKDLNTVYSTYGPATFEGGSGYSPYGNYLNVPTTGGSGTGLTLDITIAFSGSLTNAGDGYTDGEYIDIPLIYSVLPGGAIATTTNLVGGSNYVDGTYFDVPLIDGTGDFATANITISSNVVTNLTIVNGGTGYTLNDTLTFDTQDVGGSKLNTLSISNGGSNYANGTYLNVPLQNIGGSIGQGGTADITVSNNAITSAVVNQVGSGYLLTDNLTVLASDFVSNDSYTFTVTDANTGGGSTGYTFTGDATGSNPTITANKNDTLIFNVDVTPHGAGGTGGNLFWIVTQLSPSGGFDPLFALNTVSPNGVDFGTVTFTPIEAGTYYYVSESDSTLKGTINVIQTSTGSGFQASPNTLITGSGASIDVASLGSSTGGTGATANITILGGTITDFVISDGGSGYSQFDLLTADYQQMQYVDPLGNTITSVQPSTEFEFRIENLGAVTIVEVSNEGSGYEEFDELKISDAFRPLSIVEWAIGLSASNGQYFRYANNIYLATSSGTLGSTPPIHTTGNALNGDVVLLHSFIDFSYTIGSVTTENTITLEPIAGLTSSKQFKSTTNDGVNINDQLLITNNSIIRSASGNLLISASSNSQVEFGGTGAVILPSGTTSERPGLSVNDAGAIRFNTEESRFEGFNGSFFISLGGVRDVDGNTFISAELNPGDDDNTLRFFNDGVQSMQVEQTRITLQEVSNITKTNLSGVALWEASASVTAPVDPINDPPVLVYYGQNVYSVDNDGTFDASVAPTHETGTVANGTVDLTWVRNIYGNIEFLLNNINSNVDLFTINTGAIKLSGDSTLANIGSNSTDLALTFTSNEYKFIKFGSNGTISVNTSFGNVDPGTGENVETYIQVLDKDLQKFNLKDFRAASGTASIDTSSGSSASFTLFPYTESYSGKIMIEITDNSPLPRKQYSEISYLVKSDGSDILYTESNKIYTDVVLCNVEADLISDNVSVLVTDVTGSNTLIHSIKVVSNTILA